MSKSLTSEVLSAVTGGMVSATALYPLEVLKTRMQAEANATPTKAKTKIADERNERTDSCNDDGDDDAATPTAISANTSPQHDDDDYARAAQKGVLSFAALMLEREGRGAFYSGVATKTVQTSAEAGLYFLGYTALKNGYARWNSSGAGPVANLLLGCLAEWAHLPLTLPLDCLTTAIQTDTKNRGALVLLLSMLSQKGIGGFYRGAEAYVVLCLKPSIQYTVYDQVKKILLRSRKSRNKNPGAHHHRTSEDSLTAAEAFLLGMISLTISTLIVYPYLRGKVLLQIVDKNSENNKSECNSFDGSDSSNKETSRGHNTKASIPSMISQQFHNGGLASVYQGIGPQLLRGVLSASLMMMVKEKIGATVEAIVDKGGTAGSCPR